METKLEYKTQNQAPDGCNEYLIPAFPDWIEACYHARREALKEVSLFPHSDFKSNLFWIVFNYEIRQFIERRAKDNAYFSERSTET